MANESLSGVNQTPWMLAFCILFRGCLAFVSCLFFLWRFFSHKSCSDALSFAKFVAAAGYNGVSVGILDCSIRYW